MDSDARDLELEWLKAQDKLSTRAVGRLLGVHHEIIRQARLTGNLGDALRRNIRAYMEENPDGGEESSQPEDEHQSSGKDLNGDGDERTEGAERRTPERQRLSRGRRGGRRATSDEVSDDKERRDSLRLLDEIVACESVGQVAAITARIRKRQPDGTFDKGQREDRGSSRPIALAPYYTYPREATLDELKTHALALLSGAPVLKELPLDAAVSAARAVLNGAVSLLEPPPLLHGDAVMLLAMRAEASYQDAGAREVAFAPAGRRYECGLRAETLRDGITIEDRMRRYARDGHRDRPRLIGVRFSDVIPEMPYPDEDFFFGSDGWVDRSGDWRLGRAELIARWRHVGSMCDDWQAARPATLWQYALAAEKTALELTLLSPEYGMTFDRDILGDARWPTSTRLGHETQARTLLLEAYGRDTKMLWRRRLVSMLLLSLPRMALRAVDRLLRGPPLQLDGSVCGTSEWRVLDTPMTPDYTTPNPVSGYVPSRAFRLRFRHHEFEPEQRLKSHRSDSHN